MTQHQRACDDCRDKETIQENHNMSNWDKVKAGDNVTVESHDRQQQVKGYVVSRHDELYLHAGHETPIRKYREWGWGITNRHTPIALPTQPGTVIAIGEWWLVRLRPYETTTESAWELLPLPTKALTERAHANGARTQCMYANDWVLAEAEQEGGYEIISAPTD